MTKAICMRCGFEKFGCFVKCPNCKFIPTKNIEVEISISLREGEGVYSDVELTALSKDIKNKHLVDIPLEEINWHEIYGFR